MMRKLLILLIAGLILAVCLPASAELDPGAEALLLEKTRALTALMAESAGNENYLKLYLGAGTDDVADMVRRIGASGWEKPEEGTIFVLREGAVDAYLSASRLSLKDFPESLRERVRQAVVGSMPQAVVNQAGADLRRAVTVLRTGEVFLADDDFPGGAIVFLRYNPDYAVVCSFVKNAGNIVSASLVPAPADSESILKRVMGLTSLFVRFDQLYDEYPVHPDRKGAEESR